MWNRAVPAIGVVKTSSDIYRVPLIAMVTSVLVLLGAGLILGGISVAERRNRLWTGSRWLPRWNRAGCGLDTT